MTRTDRTGSGFIALCGMSAILAACSTPTPYQPRAATSQAAGGYSETKLADARYRVAFSGNNLTSRERVETYLLYRAAELAARDGYDWFLIVDRHTEHDVRTYVESVPTGPEQWPNWRPEWRFGQPGLGWGAWQRSAEGANIRTVENFEANAEIVLRRGPIPQGEERAFDARQILDSLRPGIERPRPSNRPRRP